MKPEADSTSAIFGIQVHQHDRDIRIAPVGELDLSTACRLEEKLAGVVGDGCQSLVLDLQGLTFIDSSGVRLVATWSKRARESGLDFALVRGTAPVHRVFELTGLAKSLPFR